MRSEGTFVTFLRALQVMAAALVWEVSGSHMQPLKDLNLHQKVPFLWLLG